MFAGCLRIYNKKNAELFLKLWYIQSKEIENKNKNYYEKKRELQKKQSKILPEYRRYNRLMAEWSEWNKNKTCIRKRSTEV